jgi:hypothetical protein
MIGLPSLQHEREYQADAVAALLYGRSAALAGSLWMAEKTEEWAENFVLYVVVEDAQAWYEHVAAPVHHAGTAS